MGINQVKSNKAVFLDRDGILNRAIVRDGRPYPPSSVSEVEIVPEAPEACGLLKEIGFLLIVVTNQPDVARGTQQKQKVEEINQYIGAHLPLDDFRVCFHDEADDCFCRKPKPGLLLSASRDLNIDLGKSYLIGDRWKDIEAGRRAGCSTVFVDYGYSEPLNVVSDYVTRSLIHAVRWIASVDSKRKEYHENAQ